MVLLLILVFLVFCSVYYAKTRGISHNYISKSTVIKTDLDEPIGFGYKIGWIAVKANNKKEIAELLELSNVQLSNWESGIEEAYNNSVFITPQIGEWTLAIGVRSKGENAREIVENFEKLLNKLSLKFGEAHFFDNHRVVSYYNWIKSINGYIVRSYAYSGGSDGTIKVYGEAKGPEKELVLVNTLNKDYKESEYLDDDFDYPDEELLMDIAGSWSVDPTKLEERNDIKEELGLLGNQIT